MDELTRTHSKVIKPWGFEVVFAATDAYAGKLLFVKSGEALNLHYHERKDEVLFVYDGEIQVEIDDGERGKTLFRLEPHQSIRVRPQVRHRVKAIKDTAIFEVSTPELDDIQRVTNQH